MSKQLTSRQIIVCTHSPIIWANHVGQTMELAPSATPIQLEEESKVYVSA
jgi:predicted ATPase